MSETKILSEVTGSVWKILVKEGDSVTEDMTVALIESMKMEIPLVSPDVGVVTKILCAEGDAVAEGDPIILIRA